MLRVEEAVEAVAGAAEEVGTVTVRGARGSFGLLGGERAGARRRPSAGRALFLWEIIIYRQGVRMRAARLSGGVRVASVS